MTKLIAIYTRVSREDLEVPASTRRQERACRRYAAEKGWGVADVWEDVDLSAYQRNVRRPAFQDLMRTVAGAQVDGVLVWKLDRLVRRVADFEHFWARCDSAGVFLASATEPIDSTTELGLAVIRILVTFANVESTSISLRMQARLEEKARAGVYLGRGRTFGFNEDLTALNQEEAILIQEAAARVVDGESASAIATDWRRRGVRGSRGGPWWGPALANMLRSPRLEGDNTYRGEVVARGCFPSILDPLTAAQVRAALANPRGTYKSHKPYLLSGLLRCAKCEGHLHGAPQVRRSVAGEVTTTRNYRCPSAPTGCGHTSINAAFIEDLIVSAVLWRLERRPKIRARLDPPPDASQRLTAAFQRHAAALRMLARDYYVTRELTREEWVAARDALEHELELERRALQPKWRPAASRRQGGRTRFRADWESFDFRHRRDIVASELEYAYIGPGPTNGLLDVSRVTATWWDDGPELSSTPWKETRTSGVDAWDSERWMRTKEVSGLLGLRYSTITRMSRDGILSPVKLGHHYRYLRSDVEAMAKRLAGTLTVTEAAVRIGVRRGLIWEAVKTGALPSTRRGKLYYINPTDLDSFAQDLADARAEFVGAPEAARRMQVSRDEVYRMIDRGELHPLWRRHWIFLQVGEVDAAAARLAEVRSNDDSIDSREARLHLGISDVTLLQLIREGHLPATKLRGHYRIQRTDLAKASDVLERRNIGIHARSRRIRKPAPPGR